MNPFRHLRATSRLAVMLLSRVRLRRTASRVKGSETLAPNQVLDFGTLYAENCAGCHGAEGRGGAAIALADPVYLAIADEAAIRKVIANGVRGTAMPAFAESAGGMLTDKQIDVITSAIRSRWSQPGSSTQPIRRPTRRNPRATSRKAKPPTRRTANPATARTAAADQKAAPSRMILFSRWSAIRRCGRLSSPAVRSWARQTGGEMCPASRCPTRKSRT